MNKETYQRLDRIFFAMKRRCYNPNNNKYKIYGARGIKICDEWLQNKDIFIDWAIKNGYNNNLSIDRINADGNYCPENCRWATAKEQANNMRNNIKINYNGEEYTLLELSNKLNISYGTLYKRLKTFNYDIDRLVNSPLHIRTNYTTKSGYNYIYKQNNSYSVQINKKYYGSRKTLEEAIELRNNILKTQKEFEK